jgi:hypothetical protein
VGSRLAAGAGGGLGARGGDLPAKTATDRVLEAIIALLLIATLVLAVAGGGCATTPAGQAREACAEKVAESCSVAALVACPWPALDVETREWTAWRQCIAGVALPCTSAGMVECLAVQP